MDELRVATILAKVIDQQTLLSIQLPTSRVRLSYYVYYTYAKTKDVVTRVLNVLMTFKISVNLKIRNNNKCNGTDIVLLSEVFNDA